MNVTAADIQPTLPAGQPAAHAFMAGDEREIADPPSGPISEMHAYKCSLLHAVCVAKVILKRTASVSILKSQFEDEGRTNTDAGLKQNFDGRSL
jgi:hypothetical protein